MGFMGWEPARAVAPIPATPVQPARIADQREPAARRGSALSGLALALATRPMMLARENAAGLSDLDPESPGGPPAQRSAGEPLPADFRQRAEQRFGAGLGAVRVHTDQAAAAAAEQVEARAFTVGTDVFFAPGRYDTHSRSGQRLLAHELAHVVQAQPGRAPSGPGWVSRP